MIYLKSLLDHKKLTWKCEKGHTWKTTTSHRNGDDPTGYPVCAESGFNPEKPAWFYLICRQGDQQVGIINVLDQRVEYHFSLGCKLIETTGPHDGGEILEIEKKLKNWLKVKI